MTTTPKFPKSQSSFYAEVRIKVNAYFKESKKRPSGNWTLHAKAIALVTLFLLLYINLVFFTPHPIIAIAECVLFGLTNAGIGFNIMHDGAHGSFSSRSWLNMVAACSLNILGGSSFIWNVKHNIIHHAYTNIDGVDDDIDIQPWMRMTSFQPKFKIHRYQHFYFWLLYSLLHILWIFVLDYQKYFKRRIGVTPLKMTFREHIFFWISKMLNLFLFIGLPIYFVGFSHWLIGFIIYTFISGFIMSIVFQLAHTVEDTNFPEVNNLSGRIEDDWALHQLKTTANFSTKSKLINWFVGGLNFQIEHHLFPKVSHVHYPQIQKIIKEACKKFNFPYIEYSGLSRAITSHVYYLKKMGR